MNIEKKDSAANCPYWIFSALIVAVVVLAHSPVLFNDYLRQDDWNGMLWDRRKLFSHGDLFNYVVELFRPVSVLFVLGDDYINYHIEHAWMTRLFNTFGLAASALMTFHWQRKLGEEPISAMCLAICFVLMPSSQMISSTGGYTLMIVTVLLSQLSCFYFYRGYNDASRRRRDYGIAILLLFTSLLCYPLAGTYIFIFLLMYCLRHSNEKWWRRDHFVLRTGVMTLATMASIVVIAKTIYLIFHVVPKDPSRAVNFDWDIPNKMYWWWSMLVNSVNFFDLHAITNPFSNAYVADYYATDPSWVDVAFWGIVFLAGVFAHYRNNVIQGNIFRFQAKLLLLLLIILTLTFSPALPIHYIDGFAFRYGIVTMPLLFYAAFWSVRQIVRSVLSRFGTGDESTCYSKGLCVFTLAVALLCAHNLTQFVSGLADYELNFLRVSIEREALPVLKTGQPVTLYIVDSEHRTSLPHQFCSFEYGVGFTHMSTAWLFAAAVYTMREFGYESIETDPTWDATWKDMVWDSDKLRMKVKWGYIYATKSDVPHMEIPAGTKEVYIDLNKMGTYW